MTESVVCRAACPPPGANRHHSAGILYPTVQLIPVDRETFESIRPPRSPTFGYARLPVQWDSMEIQKKPKEHLMFRRWI